MPVGPSRHRLRYVFWHGVSRQYVDGGSDNVARCLQRLDLGDSSEAVHNRHLHIHQDQVKGFACCCVDGISAILDGRQTGPGRAQDKLNDTAIDGMIFGQKNADAL